MSTQDPHPWAIGVGANVGSTEAAFAIARQLIESHVGRVVAVSPTYRTPPVGPAQPDYRNAAWRVESTLAPHELLGRLMRIERALGRDRAVEARWGPRTMDLDILHGYSRRVDAPKLTVPHPRLTERAFALVPLLDVAPELRDALEPALDDLPHEVLPLARDAEIQQRPLAATVGSPTPLDALALAVAAACAGEAVCALPSLPSPSWGSLAEDGSSRKTNTKTEQHLIPHPARGPDEPERDARGGPASDEADLAKLTAALVQRLGRGPGVAGLHLRALDGAGWAAAAFTSPLAARLSSLSLRRHPGGWQARATAAPH